MHLPSQIVIISLIVIVATLYQFIQKRRKKVSSLKVPNHLEQLFLKATTNISYTPEFYKQLFNSELYVAARPDGQSFIVVGVEQNEKEYKITDNSGSPTLLAYTSEQALQKAFGAGMHMAVIPATDLFNVLTKQKLSLFLNAYLDYSKFFTLDEIFDIVNEPNLTPSPLANNESLVQYIKPTNIPHEFISILKEYLTNNKEVLKNIHISHIRTNDMNNSIILILQLYQKDKFKQVANELGIIIQRFASENSDVPPIDIANINSDLEQVIKNEAALSIST